MSENERALKDIIQPVILKADIDWYRSFRSKLSRVNKADLYDETYAEFYADFFSMINELIENEGI